MIMSLLKQPTFRCPEYTDYIKTLPSVISDRPADDPHHLIGHGHGGPKVSDLWTIPLTRDEHTALHDMGYKTWEEKHGSQWRFVVITFCMVIERNEFDLSILRKRMN